MMHHVRNSVLIMLITGLPFSVSAAGAGDTVHFGRDVRPILSKYCFACHGPDEAARKANFRLDERESVVQPRGDDEAVIIPGDPDRSLVMQRLLSHDLEVVMPPPEFDRKLSEKELQTLRTWIVQDAEYTRHWAYIKPLPSVIPAVSNPAWIANPVDAFILARLDQEHMKPAPKEAQLPLLRRIALDLTGLPPSAELQEQFAGDNSDEAFDRAVDRLLATPAYGERWTAMWLDLARYGDSQGYIHDPPRTIWRWRDWMIEALNSNLPYDQLTIELLAGDLLPNRTTSQLIASGFHRNTTNNTEGGSIAEEYRHASVVDRVNTTMQVWLGSTMACAQCHTHKYDPFSHKEYYQLFAIFNATEDNNTEPPTAEVPQVGRETDYTASLVQLADARAKLDEQSRLADASFDQWLQTVNRASLPQDIAALHPEAAASAVEPKSNEHRQKLVDYHRTLSSAWMAAKASVDAQQNELTKISTTTLIMKEIAPRETHVAVRGDYKIHGESVAAGVPAIFNPIPEGVKPDRLGLAKWLMHPDNPLTARVAANRLWQEVFGIGLVETSEEFGNQGEPPSHPELLDWLATEYIRSGWDTKHMLKLMVMSSAYQQSSHLTAELRERDPQNRLLARGPRARLSAETLRDQALSVAGLLSSRMYGPPVHPPQPVNGLAAAFGPSTDWENSQGEDRYRRALYTQWRRNLPYPSMIAFDAPERSVCSVRRIRTNTPLQALVTLNDPVFVEAAQGLARRILREGGESAESRAKFAFRLCLVREPTEAEIGRIVGLLEASRESLAQDTAQATLLATKPLGPVPEGMDVTELAAWTVVGNVLMNLDEFLAKR